MFKQGDGQADGQADRQAGGGADGTYRENTQAWRGEIDEWCVQAGIHLPSDVLCPLSTTQSI